MEKYESKQVTVARPADQLFAVVTDFRLFGPVVQDKVEAWEATQDECSFRVQGFVIRLRIEEAEPCKMVKIVSAEGTPIQFAFWIQMAALDGNTTRVKLTLHIELNFMLKMMIGGKIQEALDTMADQLAQASNFPEGTFPGGGFTNTPSGPVN